MKRLEGFNHTLLLSAFSGLFYFAIIDNGRGPAYPEMLRMLDLTNREGSLLFAITSFVGFLLTIFSHKWLKKYDLQKAMHFGWLILSLSALFMGLSGTYQNALYMFIAAIIQGVGMGISGMTMNLMVEEASPNEKRRRTFASLHGVYGVASLLAPLIYTGFLNFQLSWQHFFYALAALGPILYFAIPNGEKVYAKVPEPDLHFKLPLPFLILLGLTIGTYVASEIVISSRLVLFLEKGMNLTNKEASLYLSGFFLFLMGGRVLMGLRDLPFKGCHILKASLVLTTIFLIIGHMGFNIFFSLTGLSMSVFFPAFMDWLAESFPKDFQKTTTFVLSGIGLHLVAMHLGFGQIAMALGVKKAMGLATILTVLSLVFLFIAVSWTEKLKTISKQPKES